MLVNNTLTVVDLAKARAYVQHLTQTDEAVAAGIWIEDLADEVESLQRALASARDSEQAALSDAAATAAENEALRDALAEMLGAISRLLGDVGRLAA
jgi:hypothetical protein